MCIKSSLRKHSNFFSTGSQAKRVNKMQTLWNLFKNQLFAQTQRRVTTKHYLLAHSLQATNDLYYIRAASYIGVNTLVCGVCMKDADNAVNAVM